MYQNNLVERKYKVEKGDLNAPNPNQLFVSLISNDLYFILYLYHKNNRMMYSLLLHPDYRCIDVSITWMLLNVELMDSSKQCIIIKCITRNCRVVMKQSQCNIDASIWPTSANGTISEVIDFFLVIVNTCHRVGFHWKHSITVYISDCSSTTFLLTSN